MKHPYAVIALLSVSGLAVVSQLYLPLPLLGLIGQRFGLGAAGAGAAMGAFSFAYACGFLVFGPLSDRIGRKPVMVAGLLLLAVITLLLGGASTPGELIAGRALQGLATASFPPAALAYLAEALPARARLWGLASLSTAFLLAGLIGQIYGGLVGRAYGLGWAFALPCPLYLAAAVLLARQPAETRAATRGGPSIAGNFVTVLRHRELRSVYGPALLLLMCFVAFYIGLDRYLGVQLREAGLDPLTTRAIAMPGFLMPLAVPVLMPRLGAQRMVTLGLVVALAGLLCSALAHGVVSALIASVIFVAGIGIGVPSLIARTNLLAAAEWRGQAVAVYSFVLFSGASFGPWLASVASPLSAPAFFVCLAVLMACAISLSLPSSRPAPVVVSSNH
ncbi:MULTISPECIES: MFS transporter [unclassified Burkholderia]|uniref:MFS transporter n=1 Tax=unclassified Burkholderia TaxID=2613784 RepID=UPI001420C4AC|nr:MULTISPECIES: MFS transporter [unclassified Burkholderia]NIE57331.1 MFS transporter [Burkholderia sp. Ap-955]NIF08057.1 MFS transporter [Burkholderia sp. Ax-1735]NIG02061.1 MFS transporter [Burkholderia sp. Tr-849]